MFIVKPYIIVSKDTLMILGPCCSRPTSAFWVSLDNIRATSWVFGAFSSSWSEYSSVSLVANVYCRAGVQLVLLIPSTIKLYLFISASIRLVFPVSNIFRTFHAPIRMFALVVRSGIDLITSKESRPSLWGVIIIPSTFRSEFIWFRLFNLVSLF